ncbi:hypothetical protein LTS14_000062 [Recurvomyces mirabilis]|uniref:uncharacterized protein n=1 Tax=Recurvomyces mirabilis TaxID=574656 RepID=UPI002DDE0C31|nr:hypothetical protein LTS14_000062 [Recurvomyces mirabilis]
MADLGKYACDSCRAKKVTCNRMLSGCQRCINQAATCVYSRSGVLRRKRKRNDHDDTAPALDVNESDDTKTNKVDLQPQIEADIDDTRDQLAGEHELESREPLGALTSLSGLYSTFWPELGESNQISSSVTRPSRGFQLFAKEKTAFWVQDFLHALKDGFPLLTAAPQHVIDLLSSNRVDEIRDTAWLVMFYAITFGNMRGKSGHTEADKTAIRANLWLAFNDIRVLLHPSDPAIQALVLLACDIQEFTTPSLCWMLVSSACRMLQSLRVDSRHLEPATRERRQILFWLLNCLDQSLALIFGRSATFHRALIKTIPMPSLAQLMAGSSASETPAFLFGAHFMRQMFLVSAVTADVWSALYEPETSVLRLQKAKRDVEAWYEQADKILGAAAIAEQPLLNEEMTKAVQGGREYMRFTYYHLKISLIRGRKSWSHECVETSQKMLHMLGDFRLDFEEAYNGIGFMWQLSYVPFTSFFVLFAKILSDAKLNSERCKQPLEAMECLPVFLNSMASGMQQAGKLEPIATTFVRHAKSVLNRRGKTAGKHTQPFSATELKTKASLSTPQSLATDDFDITAEPLFQFLGAPTIYTAGQEQDLDWQDRPVTAQDGVEDRDLWQTNMDQGFDFTDPAFADLIDPAFDWFAWEDSVSS